MSRSGYGDDCEGEALGLYRQAVDRGIRGPRGQALLREMIATLDAMPVKELAADVFVSGHEVCAMGAVAEARGLDLAGLDEYDPRSVGTLLDIPWSLAAEIAWENDEDPRVQSDAARWAHMRTWAERHLVECAPTPTGTCSWCCKRFTLRRGVVNTHKYNGARCPGVGVVPIVLADLEVS